MADDETSTITVQDNSGGKKPASAKDLVSQVKGELAKEMQNPFKAKIKELLKKKQAALDTAAAVDEEIAIEVEKYNESVSKATA